MTTENPLTPTVETYAELQLAFAVFNEHLFGGQLPDCLLTLQREKATYGYFSAGRFGNRSGRTVDEIALNPSYFAILPLLEILQTIVHEQCHLWQQHFGKPGRGRYHNSQWAAKMQEVGLMPSSTGKPGGATTGDHMADYPIEGGLFLKVCKDHLITKAFTLSWYDRFPAQQVVDVATQTQHKPTALGLPSEFTKPQLSVTAEASLPSAVLGADAIAVPGLVLPPSPRSKTKYSCSCSPPQNVWGKPGLRIRCEACGEAFCER